MADRRRQIILLIGSRFDFDWSPGGSLRTVAGLAPGVKRECPTCGGDGETLDRYKRKQPCLTCGGRLADGKKRAKRGRGWVYVDRMDADRAPIAATDHRDVATKPAHTVPCDACGATGVGTPHLRDPDDPSSEYRDPCVRCGGSGRRVVATFDLRLETERIDVDQVTAAIARRDEAGSYRELEAALRGIYAHMNKPLRYVALNLHYREALRLLDELYLPPTSREERDLNQFESSLVELALAYIDSRMPDPIRVPAGVAANQRLRDQHLRTVRGRGTSPQALQQRDKEIRKLIRQRKPTQWVARKFGLSVAQVNRIVSGDAENADAESAA